MNFTKMHGLGNDFIVVAGEQALPEGVSELAIKLCNRFFGIGADGLVFILPSDVADYKMRIINSDGSEAEQCGNAIRCVSKYAYDNGLAAKTSLTIETLGAGVQPVELELGADGKVAGARVRNVHTGETKVLDVTGVFVAIGHDPRSELFRGQVELDDEGYVKVEAPSTRTSIPGVFAAGDLVDHTYRQAITAAGTGCAAALDAERFIATLPKD